MRTGVLLFVLAGVVASIAACIQTVVQSVPGQTDVTLAVDILSPSGDRTVPLGTIVRIEWSVTNLTGKEATFSLIAESRTDLSTETLIAGRSIVAFSTRETFEWDTSGLASGPYSLIARVANGDETKESTAPGRITINEPPTFEFTAPSEPAVLDSGQTVTIGWTSDDAEGGTILRLGVDPDEDHTSGNEIFIVEREATEKGAADDTLDWDGTDEDGQAVDAGVYNLFGLVNDTVNPPLTVDGLATITVLEDPGDEDDDDEVVALGIIEPSLDTEFLAGADPLEIQIGVNEADDVLIDLKADTDDDHANGNEITLLSQRLVSAGTETETFDWDGTDANGDPVPDGIYRLFVVASTGVGNPRSEASDRLVFRRTPGGVFSRQTWERVAGSWSLVILDENASRRADAGIAYDAARGESILFGGAFESGLNAQHFRRARGDWALIFGSNPGSRSKHAMAYDAERERVVLFGGSDAGMVRMSDTWEWDGQDWILRNPTDRPSAREDHALAYDAERQVTILFGGLTGSGRNAETWSWDGDDWTQLAPADAPSARNGHAMAYDSMRQVVVLFGGETAGGVSDETWEWDGDNWTMVENAGKELTARSNHALAYDTSRQRVVLFGGSDGTIVNDETWEWDGTAWKPDSSKATPPAREGHVMAFDSTANRVVLFGGEAGSPLVALLEPGSIRTVNPGDFLNIAWRDDDPSGRASIRLTVDDDPDPAEAVETDDAEIEILSGREAPRDAVQDTFAWQVPSALAPGTYYIFAYIDQDKSDPADHHSVAPAPFIIDDPANP